MPAMHQTKFYLKTRPDSKLLQFISRVVVQNDLQVTRRSPWRASIKHDVTLLSRWCWQRYNQALLTSATTSKPLDLHSNDQPITPPNPHRLDSPSARFWASPQTCTRSEIFRNTYSMTLGINALLCKKKKKISSVIFCPQSGHFETCFVSKYQKKKFKQLIFFNNIWYIYIYQIYIFTSLMYTVINYILVKQV